MSVGTQKRTVRGRTKRERTWGRKQSDWEKRLKELRDAICDVFPNLLRDFWLLLVHKKKHKLETGV